MPVLTVRNKRILYIHVPKTGGTSVERLLESYGAGISMYHPLSAGFPCPPQHFHGDLLKRIFGMTGMQDGREHDFDFVFMTVRHPISRLRSEYRYQRTRSRAGKAGPRKPKKLWLTSRPVAEVLDFDHWCRYALWRYSRDPYFAANHLRPQVDFAIWNPVIYRLEDGIEPIKHRLDKLTGIRGDLPAEPQMVATDRGGKPDRLSRKARQLIRSYYARDFAEYGYES